MFEWPPGEAEVLLELERWLDGLLSIKCKTNKAITANAMSVLKMRFPFFIKVYFLQLKLIVDNRIVG